MLLCFAAAILGINYCNISDSSSESSGFDMENLGKTFGFSALSAFVLGVALKGINSGIEDAVERKSEKILDDAIEKEKEALNELIGTKLEELESQLRCLELREEIQSDLHTKVVSVYRTIDKHQLIFFHGRNIASYLREDRNKKRFIKSTLSFMNKSEHVTSNLSWNEKKLMSKDLEAILTWLERGIFQAKTFQVLLSKHAASLHQIRAGISAYQVALPYLSRNLVEFFKEDQSVKLSDDKLDNMIGGRLNYMLKEIEKQSEPR
ncbi:hypothetical protein [Sodalinema gerasimenkoae]|uniref:hypothetical protein n=1 Tax=Sodalinema gerasimenkoae TaxID=2862348 RepID=UPI00135A7E46|nr:hypothetical protein [Sodalinema gerasimenkoae]